MEDNILGAKIRETRKAKGLSQLEFARLCGISSPYMNKIELGRNLPSLKFIKSIALVLGTDLSDELRASNYTEDEINEFRTAIYKSSFIYSLNILNLSDEDKNLCMKFCKNISKLSKLEKSFIDNILSSKDV